MPAIQLFLFKLKYFPTVWAVKIKSVSAAYKCLVSPPRESPPSALGLGRSTHPTRPLLESAARGGRQLSGRPSSSRGVQGPLGGRREGAGPAGRGPDPLRLPPSPQPLPSFPAPAKSGGIPLDRVSGAASPGECLRWVPLQPWSLPEACRGRRFSFTLRNFAFLLPPGVSLLFFSPSLPPSLPLSPLSSLPPSLPFFVFLSSFAFSPSLP